MCVARGRAPISLRISSNSPAEYLLPQLMFIKGASFTGTCLHKIAFAWADQNRETHVSRAGGDGEEEGGLMDKKDEAHDVENYNM